MYDWLPAVGGRPRVLTSCIIKAQHLHGAARACTCTSLQHISGQPVESVPAAVPIPLCKRLPAHEDCLGTVLAWQTAMHAKIEAIGDAFQAADDGPSSRELQLEVQWALDDTIAAVRTSASNQWQPCSWRELEQDVKSASRRGQDPSVWAVQLRAPVAQLYDWWQQRLEDRVPFQYLISTAHWGRFVMSVGPGVLIPRPETEIFPEFVSQALAQQPDLALLPWCDLGTGSGAIAMAAADELRKYNKAARVLAVDLSATAAAYAAANAADAGLSQHITVLQGSWYEPLIKHLSKGSTPTTSQSQAPTCSQPASNRRLGGILSNPPYIPEPVMQAGLQAEVARHEPWSALNGGPGSGLDSLQIICSGAVELLAAGGLIALETAGKEQAPLVADLLKGLRGAGGTAAFCGVRVVQDCFGVERFVVATRAE